MDLAFLCAVNRHPELRADLAFLFGRLREVPAGPKRPTGFFKKCPPAVESTHANI
jgi:hypothetical protein